MNGPVSPRDAPPRLGKGLAELFGDYAGGQDAGPSSVRLSEVEPGPFQPRSSINPNTLDDLVASIKSQGILQPILVRRHPTTQDRYQIVAGERRWRAAALAGLSTVPVLLRDLTDADAMAAGLVENLQRRDLDAIEEAQGLRRLLEEFGLTQDQLGQAIGKSRSHIANSLRLLVLPPSVQRHVSDGRLTAGHARAALAHANPEQAAEAMIEGQLSVRDAERMAMSKPARTRKNREAGNLDVADLSSKLSERLGLVVSISQNASGGRVIIRYQNLDQLDALLTLIG